MQDVGIFFFATKLGVFLEVEVEVEVVVEVVAQEDVVFNFLDSILFTFALRLVAGFFPTLTLAWESSTPLNLDSL